MQVPCEYCFFKTYPCLQILLFSALQHPNFNPKWISFVVSKNLIANIFNFNYLI